MFNLGVTTSIFNGEMRQARKKLGYTQGMLAKVVDLPITAIGELELMKSYPHFEKLEDIADCLGSDINTMFPEWLRTQKLKKSTVTQFMPINRINLDNPVIASLEAKNELEVENDTIIRNNKLDEALSKLSDREQKIITMRFGLKGSKSCTLQEVGNEFGVTRDRIRQIEAKALAKMRKKMGTKFMAKYEVAA